MPEEFECVYCGTTHNLIILADDDAGIEFAFCKDCVESEGIRLPDEYYTEHEGMISTLTH